MRLSKNSKLIIAIGLIGSNLLLWQCKNEERPKNILTQEQFSKLILEMYLAEAKLTSLDISKDSVYKLFVPYEEKYLKKSGISDTLLHNTYQYYFDHPQEFEQIYDRVIDSLSLLERKQSK
jgi:hypothetical protein